MNAAHPTTHVVRDLRKLCRFLGLKEPDISWSVEVNRRSLEDSRAFCEVHSNNRMVIHCSHGLARLPRKNRLGVLLHELGHVYGSIDEVEADTWVVTNCPEAGFKYIPRVSYLHPSLNRKVTARNVQSVADGFPLFLDART